MPKPIKNLIVNSPFREPDRHWKFNKTVKEFELKPGRRPASYVISGGKARSYDEFGLVKEIPLVNDIRRRMREWKKSGYSGVTGVTRRLLSFWNEGREISGRKYDFFFCQLEAIETLVFLTEGRQDMKTGLHIPQDEALQRLCCKMATGAGKTAVMAMTIAWQILNKATYPGDARFSKNIFIITPNLTVRDRLQTLKLSGAASCYREYKIVPNEWRDKLRQGKVIIKNWHQLQWETEEQIQNRKGPDKRGVKSDTAYTREVLEDLAKSKNIIVLNDEAHHAWRKRAGLKIKKTDDMTKDELERATKWIEGLDRLNRTAGIRRVFDFSATPYAPTGDTADERNLFEWIVSDFGLTDAIECGIVKTPKLAVGDDASASAKRPRPKFYHIYEDEEAQPDLNRRAGAAESLPDIVKAAYTHLSHSWSKKYKNWKERCKTEKEFVPPVMISIVNRKETADRVEHGLREGDIPAAGLFKGAEKTLKVYSGMEDDEGMRDRLSAVGKIGSGGQLVHHVIAVQMLSEGWNCRTVTHILGLRAFSSQLLCEQTIGRGLRRMSYELNEDGMFEPEYAHVLGVPFAYLPQEGSDTGRPEEEPRNCIFPEPERSKYEITWPNVERIDCQLRPELKIDFSGMSPYTADVSGIPRLSELAPIIDGKPRYEDIELTSLQEFFEQEHKGPDRMQTLILRAAGQIYENTNPEWKKGILKHHAVRMIFQLTKRFINSPKFQVRPAYEKERKSLAVMLKMNEIVSKVFSLIQKDSTEELSVIYDRDSKFSSTKESGEWWTKKKTAVFKKTHINQCVTDSPWEYTHARELDKNKDVRAWVKNDHLGFVIDYIDEKGRMRPYTPDFIARLSNGDHLILEVKGIKKPRDIQKWDFMKNWAKAVSESLKKSWHFKISQDPTGGMVHKIIEEILRK